MKNLFNYLFNQAGAKHNLKVKTLAVLHKDREETSARIKRKKNNN